LERNHAGIDCCYYQCKKIFLYANTLFFAYRTNISSYANSSIVWGGYTLDVTGTCR
jgi:cardiolipin synthetase 2 (EC 2.7.8.-)